MSRYQRRQRLASRVAYGLAPVLSESASRAFSDDLPERFERAQRDVAEVSGLDPSLSGYEVTPLGDALDSRIEKELGRHEEVDRVPKAPWEQAFDDAIVGFGAGIAAVTKPIEPIDVDAETNKVLLTPELIGLYASYHKESLLRSPRQERMIVRAVTQQAVRENLPWVLESEERPVDQVRFYLGYASAIEHWVGQLRLKRDGGGSWPPHPPRSTVLGLDSAIGYLYTGALKTVGTWWAKKIGPDKIRTHLASPQAGPADLPRGREWLNPELWTRRMDADGPAR